MYHTLEDKHHIFQVVSDENGKELQHTWGQTATTARLLNEAETSTQEAARILNLTDQDVWITPYMDLTKMGPLWAGQRRWTRTRRQYRELTRREEARRVLHNNQKKWEKRTTLR